MAAAAAAAKEGSPYEGGTGAGGKFRKRPFRRLHSTPYDRPPTAFRNPSGTTNNGWFSKFVDPASKLISASAHRFFSSVFRKRLPPPAQPSQSLSEAKKESWANLGEAVSTNPFRAQERTINEGDNPSNNFDSSRFAELEQILKQKTFTRSEIERLTALLHSRTVDMTIPTVEGRSEANHLERVASQNREEEHPNTEVQENGFESHKLLGITSTPNARSRVLEDDVASPAELAKAYMGSRPSKVSPSMLGLRSQAFREDSPTLRNLPFRSKSPITSLVPKSSVHVGVPENGFITPKSRGRSAIYSMARTPYSRIHLSTCHKGSGFTHDVYAGPSSSQFASEQSRNSCSKQAALKRRSSVLDYSIGSVGPIRRIRQRPNLSSSKNLSLPASENALSVDGSGAVPKLQTECADNSIPGTSFGSVPSHSSEMAQKILQQLHTLVPDSKEKSDTKLVTAREKSPSRLTPDMLSGQALMSLENVDSSKCLESARDTKFDGLLSTCLLDSRDSTSLKQDSPEENGASRFMDLRAAAVNGFGTEVLNKHASRIVKTDESGITYPVAHPPQKKRAFQMSAHEDCLDLDDDGYSNGTTFTPLAESRENLDTSLVESKTVAAEAVAFSEFKLPASSSSNKRTELETSDGVLVAGKSTGFTFPVAPATSMTSQPALHALQSPTQSDDVFSRNERNVALPVSSFSSRHMDETPPFSFSSSMSASECSVLKLDDSSDTKAEAFVSLDAVVAGATNTVPETADPDKGDNNNFFTTPKTEISSSPASSVGIFSCVDTPASPSVVNGSISSSPCIISYPTPILNSSNVSDQTIFSTVTTITTSSSDVSNSSAAAAAAAAAASVFKFGSSVSPSTSESVTCVVEVTPDSLVKNKQESVFANLSSKPFGGTGSGFFGFSASATSTATNLSQGTGMGSSVGRNSTQSMPIQFPASSPTFGLSGSANFASGGGSLNSASTFGGGSLTSSSGANSSAAAAATTSFSWQQPSTSPTYTATSSFTSMAPSSGSGFTFAAASVASTNTTSPLVFGSTGTGSSFSFSSPAVNGTLSSAVRSPIFGNPNMFGNNDQMSMEDSMAEDNTQAVAASMNPFGFASQPAPSGFMYNSSATPFQSTAAAPTANSFQFASQQSLNTPSQFQASSSLGSFSLGAGGGDKSNRKMIKVVRKGNRKK